MTPAVQCRLHTAAPTGPSPLDPCPFLEPSPSVGLSPPRAPPSPPAWPGITSLDPLPSPSQPPDRPHFTAPCRVRTEEGHGPRRSPGGVHPDTSVPALGGGGVASATWTTPSVHGSPPTAVGFPPQPPSVAPQPSPGTPPPPRGAVHLPCALSPHAKQTPTSPFWRGPAPAATHPRRRPPPPPCDTPSGCCSFTGP